MRWIPRIELIFALAACEERLSVPIPAAHPDENEPHRGGTMRLASFADIRSLDPAGASDALSAGISEQIFAGLVDFDDDGHVVPDLAESIDVSGGGSSTRFRSIAMRVFKTAKKSRPTT